MDQNTTFGTLLNSDYQGSMSHNQNEMQENIERELYRLENRCRSALIQLGKSMGYNLKWSSVTDRKLVLADAVSTLEKLKFGERVTRRPRELEEREIMTTLQNLIPANYVTRIFVRAGATEIETARSELIERMVAASSLINELKKQGGGIIREPVAVVKARALCKRPIAVPNIEVVLEKMEEWCNAWLNGDLKDDEWETFENCLDK